MGIDIGKAWNDTTKWVGDRLDDVDDAKNFVGGKIDEAVKTAEDAVDGFREDVVAFGKENGGIVGEIAGQYISHQIGATEGLLLGAYDMGKGVVQLADGLNKVTNPLEWVSNPQENFDRVTTAAQTGVAVGSLFNVPSWVANPQGNANTATALWNGLTQGYQEAAADGDYSKIAGRLTFDVGSMFVGVGEANAVVKGGSTAAHLAEGLNAADKVADGSRALTALPEAGAVGQSGRVLTTPLREVGELPKVDGKLQPLGEGDVLVGRSTSIMRDHAARQIAAVDNHPLKFLLNPETNKFWTRQEFGFTRGYEQHELFDNPVLLDMGHIASNKSLTNGGDRIMLQSVFENQWNNRSIETPRIGGEVSDQRAVNVGGVAVSYNDVKMWTELKIDADMAQKLAPFGYKEGDTFLPKSVLDNLVNVN